VVNTIEGDDVKEVSEIELGGVWVRLSSSADLFPVVDEGQFRLLIPSLRALGRYKNQLLADTFLLQVKRDVKFWLTCEGKKLPIEMPLYDFPANTRK
jgi:hypothetical protein